MLVQLERIVSILFLFIPTSVNRALSEPDMKNSARYFALKLLKISSNALNIFTVQILSLKIALPFIHSSETLICSEIKFRDLF